MSEFFGHTCPGRDVTWDERSHPTPPFSLRHTHVCTYAYAHSCTHATQTGQTCPNEPWFLSELSLISFRKPRET